MTTTQFVATRPASEHAWDTNGVCQIHGGYCSMAATTPYTDDDTQPALAVVGRELWEATHDIIPAVLVSAPDADLLYRALAERYGHPADAGDRFDALLAVADARAARLGIPPRPAMRGERR